MAPEVIAGHPSTSRSDIYSVGVMLYQLIVGDLKRPLTTDWRDGIDDPIIAEDLTRCFAGDPEARFSTASELAEHLRSYETRRASFKRRERAQRAVTRRRRAVIFLGSLAGIILLAIFLSDAIQLRRTKMGMIVEPSPTASPQIQRPVVPIGTPILPIEIPSLPIETPRAPIETAMPQIERPGVQIGTQILPIEIPSLPFETPRAPIETAIVTTDPNSPEVRRDVQQLRAYLNELEAVKEEYEYQEELEEQKTGETEFFSLGGFLMVCENGLNNFKSGKYYNARGCFSQFRSYVQSRGRTILERLRNEGKLTFSPQSLVQVLERLSHVDKPDEKDLIPVFITVKRAEGSFLQANASAFEDEVINHAAYAFRGSEIPIKKWPHKSGSRYTCEISYTVGQRGKLHSDLVVTAQYTVNVIDNKTGKSILQFDDHGEYQYNNILPVIVLHMNPVDDEKRVFDPSCFNFREHFEVLKLER